MLRPIGKVVLLYFRRKGPLFAKGIAYSLLVGSIPLLLMTASVASYLYNIVPQVQTGLHWRIRDVMPETVAAPFILHIERMASSWAEIGVAGILILIMVSKGIFDAVGSGLTGVMGAGHHRRPVIAHIYSVLLTIISIVLFVVVSLDSFLIRTFVEATGVSTPVVDTYTLLASAFSIFLLGTALLLMYLAFSPMRISTLYAGCVSYIVSCLFHILGAAGKFFVGMFARYRLIYGVFSGSVLFLVWLQFFAHLVLIGGMLISRHGTNWTKTRKIPVPERDKDRYFQL